MDEGEEPKADEEPYEDGVVELCEEAYEPDLDGGRCESRGL